MANQIALKFDFNTIVLSKLKLALPYKTQIYNESKTVRAMSAKFYFDNPRLAQAVPEYRRNGLFILSR